MPHSSLPQSDDGPAFDEPWQAQVLGIADRLVDAGVLSAKDWAEGLGRELQTAMESGAPDNKETYHRAVLTALERLLGGSGVIRRDELGLRSKPQADTYWQPKQNPILVGAGLGG